MMSEMHLINSGVAPAVNPKSSLEATEESRDCFIELRGLKLDCCVVSLRILIRRGFEL